MAKQFKIEVEDHVFITDLLEDKAPKTCEAFWNALPFEQEMLQVKWSGHVSYVLTDMELEEAECMAFAPATSSIIPMCMTRRSIPTRSPWSMARRPWRP